VGEAPLTSFAEPIVRRALGAGARVVALEPLKSWERSDLYRIKLEGTSIATAILKRFKDRARGFDDWAGLAFLGGSGAPTFLGGHVEECAFLVEDLGEGRTLEGFLNAEDRSAAEEALLELARLTGKVQAIALAHVDRYEELRDALAPREGKVAALAGAFLRKNASRVRDWLAAVGVTAELDRELELVAKRVEDPGPFASFTHGDMAPTNNFFGPRGARLLDFEWCGVRHALYDTLLWNLFCPFPDELAVRADAAYRAQLAKACVAARDDRHYERERAFVAAGRMLNMLQWHGPALLEADRPWAPDLTARQALAWHLRRFHALAAPVRELGATVEALAALETRLRDRWRIEAGGLVPWKALQG
jgi:hypothetical protein